MEFFRREREHLFVLPHTKHPEIHIVVLIDQAPPKGLRQDRRAEQMFLVKNGSKHGADLLLKLIVFVEESHQDRKPFKKIDKKCMVVFE